MPTYLMLTTLTPQGVQTLKANPSRLREVNRDVEELGAKVLHQWATLGEYDFVNIVEAPDAATVAKVSLALGARGSAKLQSLELDRPRHAARRARRLAVARRSRPTARSIQTRRRGVRGDPHPWRAVWTASTRPGTSRPAGRSTSSSARSSGSTLTSRSRCQLIGSARWPKHARLEFFVIRSGLATPLANAGGAVRRRAGPLAFAAALAPGTRSRARARPGAVRSASGAGAPRRSRRPWRRRAHPGRRPRPARR